MRRKLRVWLRRSKMGWGWLAWQWDRFYRSLSFFLLQAWHGVASWFYGRSSRELLRGLPAVLALAGVAAAAGAAAFDAPNELTNRYHQYAAQKLNAKEFAPARIAFERLVALDGARPEFRYGLALAS